MTSPGPLPRRRWATLLLWLACLALALWQIARTTFVADLSAFLPAHPDAQQQLLIEQLQSGVAARTLLIGIAGSDAAARATASRALAADLRTSGLFDSVQNGETGDWEKVGRWLFEHRYQLSPAVTAERFTAAGLRDAIGDTLSQLGTPAGNALKPLLDRDPTGETQRIAEALIPSNAPKTEDGVWASRQLPRAVLVAGVRAAGADLDSQALAVARVKSAFQHIATPGLQLQMSGAPVLGVDSRAQIESEITFLASAGTLLMSALLLLAFASLRALAVAALPVASGVLTGIAAVSLGFGSVHGITLGFGTTLIGEAVDYAIYFLIQARVSGWRDWLRQGWPTVRLGLLTSICGFVALVFSGFPGLAQLGVFSVAGLIGAALTTRFVLPVLMPDGASGRRGEPMRRRLGRAAAAAARVLPRWRAVPLLLGLASVLVLWQRSDLWQAELSSLSPLSRQALALDASLRADLSAGDARSLVVVQGADLQTTLRQVEAVTGQLDRLEQAGAIGGYDSVTRWLPSLARQQMRQAALPDEPTLRTALIDATRGGPLPAARLEAFVADLQAARSMPTIELADMRQGGLSALVDALLLQRGGGGWAALVPLQPAADGGVDSSAVTAALQGLDGTQSIEIGVELKRLYRRYLGEAQWQALLGAGGVVALCAIALRSSRRLLAVCQPLVLAVLLTMGALAALGTSLGILHLVGLLLVVAVGSNYALFFDLLHSRGGADDDTLASLLLANLTTVGSFGLIALSSIPALSAIGRVVAPGALLALVLAATFAPSAIRLKATSAAGAA